MPRVLRIVNRLNLGGPTYNVAYLTARLAPEFETLLVAGMKDDSEESSEFILDNLQVRPRYIHTMRRQINFTDDRIAYTDISKIIREFKPDIVHTHAAKAGALGRIAAWQQGVPVILHTFHGHVFHSYFNTATTRFFIGTERLLARISTGIIAISEAQKRDLSQIYGICQPDKVRTIPLGFDLSGFDLNKAENRRSFRSVYGLDDETVAVGIIGRLVPVKNHPLFLRAWQRLTARHGRKIHAFIIGDGEDRQSLERLCHELELTFNTSETRHEGANLTFTSWIYDIKKALQGLDIVALCSNNEGTPVSLIEAQAAGKAIISTDAGGLQDTVIPGETALIVPPGDLDAFQRELDRLITDQDLRAGMSARGPAFASRRFHVNRLVDDMRNYYHEQLEKHATAGKRPAPPVREKSPGENMFFPAGKSVPRVLKVVNRLNVGGITYNVASIAARIRPEFDTQIVAGMKEPTEESSEYMLKALGLDPIFIPDMKREINIFNDKKAYEHLNEVIRDYRPDIVHTHAAKAGLIGRMAASNSKVPVIVHTYHGHVFHSYFGPLKTRLIIEMERYLGNLSSAVIAISQRQQHELSSVYKVIPDSKIRMIELGYNLEPFQTDMMRKRENFRNRFGIGAATVAVGIIGRIVKIKNIKLFIDAWNQAWRESDADMVGMIIGDGDERPEMEEYCTELGIPWSSPENENPHARIIFTSWIFDADQAMAGLDIIALTSLNEGTPASLIEAQAAGVPIVTTDVGGVLDIVLPGRSALVVPSKDTEAFSSALLRLVNDESLRKKMRESGPEIVNSRFNYNRLTSDIINLYNDLLSGKKSTG